MKIKSINISNILFLTLLTIIIFYGIVGRYHNYFFHTGFFCDEACLVKNITERKWFELFLPLNYGQCCPPLFLIFSKIIYSFFGLNERALTFINFSASILSILTFYFLSAKIFKNKLSILFSMFLFVFSDEKICSFFLYFKQYASDVLFSIVLILLFLYLKNKKLTNSHLFLLSLLAIFISFASYTAIFIIFVLILYWIIKYLDKKYFWQNTRNSLFFLIPYLSTMVVFFYINCLPNINNVFLQSFWSGNTQTEIFYPQSFSQLKTLIVFFSGNGSHDVYLILFLLVFSIYKLFQKDKSLLYVLVMPFVLGAFLGFFHFYPFAPQRISLYLIPLFILLISYPFEYCKFDLLNFSIKQYTLSIILIIVLFQTLKIPSVIKLANKDLLDTEVLYWAVTKQFTEVLVKSDITDNDYILGDSISYCVFDIYDYNHKLNKNNILYVYNGFPPKEIKKGDDIYFFIRKIPDSQYQHVVEWINNKNNCKIIYQIDGYYGKFTKCEVL